MIPLYGFLEGDTIGLLVMADEHDTIAELAAKLVQSASVRVAPAGDVEVYIDGKPVLGKRTVAGCKLKPLDRIDVRRVRAA